ncbi:MAG: hypothetical protein QM479_09485, partial [Pseudomonadota bacterium]
IINYRLKIVLETLDLIGILCTFISVTNRYTSRYPIYQDKMENGYKTRKTELKLWIKLLDILHLFPP